MAGISNRAPRSPAVTSNPASSVSQPAPLRGARAQGESANSSPTGRASRLAPLPRRAPGAPLRANRQANVQPNNMPQRVAGPTLYEACNGVPGLERHVDAVHANLSDVVRELEKAMRTNGLAVALAHAPAATTVTYSEPATVVAPSPVAAVAPPAVAVAPPAVAAAPPVPAEFVDLQRSMDKKGQEDVFIDAIYQRFGHQPIFDSKLESLEFLNEYIDEALRNKRNNAQDANLILPGITAAANNKFRIQIPRQGSVLRSAEDVKLHILIQSHLAETGALSRSSSDVILLTEMDKKGRNAPVFDKTKNHHGIDELETNNHLSLKDRRQEPDTPNLLNNGNSEIDHLIEQGTSSSKLMQAKEEQAVGPNISSINTQGLPGEKIIPPQSHAASETVNKLVGASNLPSASASSTSINAVHQPIHHSGTSDKARNYSWYFDSSVDMAHLHTLLKNTHEDKKIAGFSNHCWWRSGWTVIFSQWKRRGMDELKETLSKRLGKEFDSDLDQVFYPDAWDLKSNGTFDKNTEQALKNMTAILILFDSRDTELKEINDDEKKINCAERFDDEIKRFLKLCIVDSTERRAVELVNETNGALTLEAAVFGGQMGEDVYIKQFMHATETDFVCFNITGSGSLELEIPENITLTYPLTTDAKENILPLSSEHKKANAEFLAGFLQYKSIAFRVGEHFNAKIPKHLC